MACYQPGSLLGVHNLLHSEILQHLRGNTLDTVANDDHLETDIHNVDSLLGGPDVYRTHIMFVFYSSGDRSRRSLNKPES